MLGLEESDWTVWLKKKKKKKPACAGIEEKYHMEASCQSLPSHTFLRGNRPTQDTAEDTAHIDTAQMGQVSQVFPQMVS